MISTKLPLFRTPGSSTVCLTRYVSSKYPKPTPRPYKRRLFEQAIAPVLPKEIKLCTAPGLVHRKKLEESREYSDVEIALSKLVKDWIVKNEYRLMAVCQFMPVPGRTLWLAKNQLRLNGLEFRNYGNKIMKKVFEDTPISSLDVVFCGSTAVLFSRDVGAIKNLITETDKLKWIIPLVVMVDSRILPMTEVNKLARLPSLEQIRAETVQILSSQISQLPQSLDTQIGALSNNLSQLALMKEQQEQQ